MLDDSTSAVNFTYLTLEYRFAFSVCALFWWSWWFWDSWYLQFYFLPDILVNYYIRSWSSLSFRSFVVVVVLMWCPWITLMRNIFCKSNIFMFLSEYIFICIPFERMAFEFIGDSAEFIWKRYHRLAVYWQKNWIGWPILVIPFIWRISTAAIFLMIL